MKNAGRMQQSSSEKINDVDYISMTDEQVDILARRGDGNAVEYLLNKYKNFARSKAHFYYIVGANKADIVQEGMIGLFKAIRDYKDDKQCSFHAFAELCIMRQIITAIKSATRQKHTFLNSYVSLNKPAYDDDTEKTLMDTLSSTHVQNPEEILIDKENYDIIEEKIGETLSTLEKKVLALYLEDKTYAEISEELDKPVKSVDNALQRIKAKLNKVL